MVTLNALRNTAAYFVLMIVSMGYGVVRPTLGKEMPFCVALSIAYFLSNILMNLGSIAAHRKDLVMSFVCILPISIVSMILFPTILTSLTTTIEQLERKRQTYKTWMYMWLWRLLCFTIAASLLLSVSVMLTFNLRRDLNWFARNWESLWFVVLLDLNSPAFINFVGFSTVSCPCLWHQMLISRWFYEHHFPIKFLNYHVFVAADGEQRPLRDGGAAGL